MRSLLTVMSDEGLLNRIKLTLTDNTIKYYFSTTGEEAANIAASKEIAVVILDYINPVISGPEICEMLLSYNPETQFIMFFDDKYTKEVLDAYNSLHINKLVCKEHLVLEDLPSLVDSCLHTYNRDEELDKMDKHYARMNEMYLSPMNEMSSILNERLTGYDYVIKVIKNSMNFVLGCSQEALEAIDNYVDKVINDYIQIFMINEPDILAYFDRIDKGYNKPDEKKYFKFINESTQIPDKIKNSLLFSLGVIANYFDIFFLYYRGKVSIVPVEDDDSRLEINAIYEIRNNQAFSEINKYILNAVNNILKLHTVSLRYSRKNSILQFKAVIGQNEERNVQ